MNLWQGEGVVLIFTGICKIVYLSMDKKKIKYMSIHPRYIHRQAWLGLV